MQPRAPLWNNTTENYTLPPLLKSKTFGIVNECARFVLSGGVRGRPACPARFVHAAQQSGQPVAPIGPGPRCCRGGFPSKWQKNNRLGAGTPKRFDRTGSPRKANLPSNMIIRLPRGFVKAYRKGDGEYE